MVMDPEKLQMIFSFAIDKEQEAYEFYMDLAKKMDRHGMREVFEGFAHEEARHKQRLLEMSKQGKLVPHHQQILDLKIADYLVDVEPSPDMNYQQAVLLAMKREKAAFRLYTDLANALENNEDKLAILALAQEEAKHKLRFELEYDELLSEN